MYKMKLLTDLLVYFDQKSILSEMRASSERYLTELTREAIAKFPPFRFLLEIDVIELLDVFPDLGVWLLEEPLKFKKACNDILFACLQSLNEDNKAVEAAQVANNLRLKCVPSVLVRPNQPHYRGLISFNGCLLSLSKPESYVYHTVWSCPEECEGNEVILQYIPKVPPKCYICKSLMFENSGLRRCGERAVATFYIKNTLLPKSVPVVDDFISKLKTGSRYFVYATITKKSTTVLSIEQEIPLCVPISPRIPNDIENLYKACKGIPWQFIYCLSSSIGVSVCPLHHFMHLKICLLLSLASVYANTLTGSTIVHVLAAGYDTGHVSRLMENAANLAQCAVFLGTSNTAASTALIGSSGGVCIMPLPLHIYNQKQTSIILSSIETGEVTIDKQKVKLQSAVWAHGMDYKKMIILNVASVFGTVCRGDYGEYSDEFVDFLLQNAVEPLETCKEELQAVKDVKEYIELVAGIDVSLDGRSERLLREYFLAARRERPRGVTVGSMGALVAISLTSAKLCRRRVANVDDAVFAIWLHVCGSPEPRFAPEEYLQTPADVKRLQKMMDLFKEWLEQFTGCSIS